MRACKNPKAQTVEPPDRPLHLPLQKEDINIQLSDNYLTITAEHRTESEEKDKKGNYIRRERTWGSYSRSFDVSDINTAQIKAGYQNGVLTLNLPKRTETTPSSRTVAIE